MTYLVCVNLESATIELWTRDYESWGNGWLAESGDTCITHPKHPALTGRDVIDYWESCSECGAVK